MPWQSSEYNLGSKYYVSILNIKELRRVLDMPQYGLAEYVWIYDNKQASEMYDTIYSARSL